MNGRTVSGTTIWEHIRAYNSYISDSLVITGLTNAVGPLCGSTSPTPITQPTPTATREDKAITWALSQVGSPCYTTVSAVKGKTVYQGHVSLAIGDGRYVMGGVIPTSSYSSVAVFSKANPASNPTILGSVYAPTSCPGR